MVKTVLSTVDKSQGTTDIEVTDFGGLLVNYAVEMNASMLIRGLRRI